jgi:hypothetical protein
MATIDLASEGVAGLHPSKTGVKGPYVVRYVIDIADAVTEKGSALAQADVIQAIPVPANTRILDAGLYCKTAMTGTSTDLTFDFGITGGDVDNYVDGWDFDAAVAGDFATPVGIVEPVTVTTADTIDILLITQTGTLLTGEVIAWALLYDISDVPASEPGIAQPGS